MLLILATELVVTSTLSAYHVRRRKKLFQKWLEGSLSIEELKQLKATPWFQKVWNPTKQKICLSKKNN